MYNYSKNISEFKDTKFIPQVWIDEVKQIVTSTNIIGTDGTTTINTYFHEQPTNDEILLLDSLRITINWVTPTATPITTPTGDVLDFGVNEDGIPTIGGQTLLVSGANIQGGDVVFEKDNTKNVIFVKSFKNKPYVDLTLEDASTIPPYRCNVTKTGMTIKFKTKYTGIVEWKATEKN